MIRPHVLGKFRRLLGAVAASPAMLDVPRQHRELRPARGLAARAGARAGVVNGLFGIEMRRPEPQGERPMTEGGLNENYARELLELHTLGVDGGYTQKDVEEVARCFTGWASTRSTGKFSFEGNRHDDGEKTVLGHDDPRRRRRDRRR